MRTDWRRHDQLDALQLEVAGDLEREAADVVQRTRPVREARAVTEVDEILVGHGHEALVENGQPTHPRVERSDRSRIHRPIVG